MTEGEESPLVGQEPKMPMTLLAEADAAPTARAEPAGPADVARSRLRAVITRLGAPGPPRLHGSVSPWTSWR
jgi:hypothetical protein